MTMTESTSKAVLSGHERYNVDVPSGKSKFLKHFFDLIDEKKTKKALNDYQDNEEPEFEIATKKEDDEVFDNKKMEQFKENAKDKVVTKDLTQKRIEEIDLTIEPARKPSFYYYKRWLWMMFPWVCMSVNKKQTFSELINKCYSSNIRYLSVEEENLFTKHAIKIVIEAKRKKKLALGKKDDDDERRKSVRNTITSKQHLKTVHSEQASRVTVGMKSQMGTSMKTLKPINPNREKDIIERSVGLVPLPNQIHTKPAHKQNSSVMSNANNNIADSGMF